MVLILTGTTALSWRRHDAHVVALTARIDSLAVTLGQVTAKLNQGRSTPPRVATVSLRGGVGYIGAPSSPIVMVAFEDYQCPFCARFFTSTFDSLRARYIDSGDVQYVAKALALPMHSEAIPAATAAACAYNVSKPAFLAYHRALYLKQAYLADSTYAHIAARLGVDGGEFRNCLHDARTTAGLEEGRSEALKVGITGTPSFVIGRRGRDGTVRGTVISGAVAFARFDAVIKQTLAAAEDKSN